MPPSDIPALELLLSQLKQAVQSGNGWMALCPAHADTNPSLSIKLGDDGRILIHCFAGCQTESVLAAVGLGMNALAAPAAQVPVSSRQERRGKGWARVTDLASFFARKIGGRAEATYEYEGSDGVARYAVIRLRVGEEKEFRTGHLEGVRWHPGDPPGPLPLYRLGCLAPATLILVVEGEKCVLIAQQLGITATTSSHGAGSAGKTDWGPLAGKRVIIAPDKDVPGEEYAAEVVGILRTNDPKVEVGRLDLPGLEDGQDIADWHASRAAAGLQDPEISAELAGLLEQAKPWPAADSTYSTDSTGPVQGAPSWSSPGPINRFKDPPPFPIETAFPASCARLKEFVQAVAESYQVPVDLPAMLAIACFGLALSRTVEVAPMPDWREPLAIYVLVLMLSGERKSPVFGRMINPIREWQRQRGLSMALSVAMADNEIKLLNEKLSSKRAKAAKKDGSTDGDSMAELLRKLTELEQSRPKPPALIATESTTEAIADLLAENNERGMIAAAEGDILDVMLGRYGQGKPNFGLWLSGHAGDSIEIRRKGRPTLRLARPALTVALAVQPDAISDLLASKAAAGRGVLARFFFSRPQTKLGYRNLTPPKVPTAAADWYGTRLHQLLDNPVPDEPKILRLSPGADRLLLQLRHWIETELRPEGLFDDHKAWGAKLAGAIVRIAGVLHGVAHPDLEDEAIDEKTMDAALTWVPYLEAHERYVAWLAGDDGVTVIADRILAWARRGKANVFSRNDAFNAVRGILVKVAKDLDMPLELLEELCWIRPLKEKPRSGPGRPPSKRFEVNPLVHAPASKPAPHNTQNTQNPAGPKQPGQAAGGEQ